MKKFSRCVLVLILVTIISAAGGYIYENDAIAPMYTSTAQLYVIPGEENEATVRASNGGLNNDFMIVFTSSVVISEAQKAIGTSEDIASYLQVSSPANSNIVEITCTNPDQATAKAYVDAVAQTAVKTTSIIPVKSIQILTRGTTDHEAVKPGLFKNVLMITGVGAAACLLVELLVLLLMGAFKPAKDNSDDETEYERRFGKYAALPGNANAAAAGDSPSAGELKASASKKKTVTDMTDVLEDFDEDYETENDSYFDEKAAQEERTAYAEAMSHVAASMEADASVKEVEHTFPKEELQETEAEVAVQVSGEEEIPEIVFEEAGQSQQEKKKTLKSSAEVLGIIKK